MEPIQPSQGLEAKAHLIVEMSPWKMAFSARSLSIGESRFVCVIDQSQLPAGIMNLQEVQTFIKAATMLTIQLFFEAEDIPVVLPYCFLETSRIESAGVIFEFAFPSKPPELADLLLASQNS